MHTTTKPTRRPSRRARPLRRAGVVLGTAVVLVLGLLATAQAKTTVERGEWTEGLYYGDGEVLLFAGGTAEDFCIGNEPVHDARYRYPAGGGFVMTVQPTEVHSLYLYESDKGAPEFLAEDVCEQDDPPEPFAAGDGHMKLRFDTTSGLPHIVNSSWGTVTSYDGVTWRVRGRADLMIGADGFPTEDPSVFQSLQLVRTGR